MMPACSSRLTRSRTAGADMPTRRGELGCAEPGVLGQGGEDAAVHLIQYDRRTTQSVRSIKSGPPRTATHFLDHMAHIRWHDS
jgi:hypothetical protein